MCMLVCVIHTSMERGKALLDLAGGVLLIFPSSPSWSFGFESVDFHISSYSLSWAGIPVMSAQPAEHLVLNKRDVSYATSQL